MQDACDATRHTIMLLEIWFVVLPDARSQLSDAQYSSNHCQVWNSTMVSRGMAVIVARSAMLLTDAQYIGDWLPDAMSDDSEVDCHRINIQMHRFARGQHDILHKIFGTPCKYCEVQRHHKYWKWCWGDIAQALHPH